MASAPLDPAIAERIERNRLAALAKLQAKRAQAAADAATAAAAAAAANGAAAGAGHASVGPATFPTMEAFFKPVRADGRPVGPANVRPAAAVQPWRPGGVSSSSSSAGGAPGSALPWRPGSTGQMVGAPGAPKQLQLWRVEIEVVDSEHVGLKAKYHKRLYAILRNVNGNCYDHETASWKFPKHAYTDLVHALESFARDPEADVTLEFERIPPAIVDLFGLGSRRSSHDADALKSTPTNLEDSRVPRSLLDSLLPFQREGVSFALKRKGRVLIADDMGLGKTLQAICVACFYITEWPLLVICPSSLRFTWAEQFQQWACPAVVRPADINVVVDGSNMLRGRVNIISYDMVNRILDRVTDRRFQVIVADESHFLKSGKAKRTKAIVPLLQNAARAILLSGTPALSRPSELFTQISAVNPKLFTNFVQYGKRYCAGVQRPFGWDFSGGSNLRELQVVLEGNVLIRRLKADVLKQLPPKRRQQVFVTVVKKANKELNGLNDAQLSSLLDAGEPGQDKRMIFMDLWRQTAAAKLTAMIEYVQDLLEGGQKFLLFAHHQFVMDAFAETLNKQGIGYIRIDGKTNSDLRQESCNRFQNSPDCRVALLSITAASVGLTLHAASLVVFAELWWNPGALLQAEDRVHRIGQQNAVNIQYLLARGTLDDKFWPLLRRKLNTLERVGLTRPDELDVNQSIERDDPAQTRIAWKPPVAGSAAGSAAAPAPPDALAPADDWMQSLVFADDDSADVVDLAKDDDDSADVVDLAKDDDDDGGGDMANDHDTDAVDDPAVGVENPTRRLVNAVPVDVDAVPAHVIDLDGGGADDGGLMPMRSGTGAAAPKRPAAATDVADGPDPKRRVRRFL